MLIAKGHQLNSTTRKELLEYLSTQHVIVFYFAEITYCIKAHLSPNHYTNLHYKFTSPRDLDGHKKHGWSHTEVCMYSNWCSGGFAFY